VSFAAITLCVASQGVFIVVSIYFIIDSVWKLLDTPSYDAICTYESHCMYDCPGGLPAQELSAHYCFIA
jgi:hypothetical protein